MSLCPICFSESGTWSDDPIRCTPSLSTEEFKGFTIIKPTHIIEIQNSCNLAEAEAGLPLTAWTVVNNTNLFQVIKTCIKELRTSIENILIASSSDKYHYFNYDKDGNYMGTTQTEWHDIDLDSNLIQIKAIHLEDLRHHIMSKPDLIVNDITITDLGIVDGFGTYDITYTVKNQGGGISGDCSGLLREEVLSAYITVHAHNPEGKEINTITGVGSAALIWVDGVQIGVAGHSPLTILSGHRVIEVKFNGYVLEQSIDINGGDSRTLTFVFARTEIDVEFPTLNATWDISMDYVYPDHFGAWKSLVNAYGEAGASWYWYYNHIVATLSLQFTFSDGSFTKYITGFISNEGTPGGPTHISCDTIRLGNLIFPKVNIPEGCTNWYSQGQTTALGGAYLDGSYPLGKKYIGMCVYKFNDYNVHPPLGTYPYTGRYCMTITPGEHSFNIDNSGEDFGLIGYTPPILNINSVGTYAKAAHISSVPYDMDGLAV
jgi:hypothetical protein